MIKIFISWVMLLIIVSCSGQEDKAPFFLNEINVSINRTDLKNASTLDKWGIGLSVYRVKKDNSKLQFIFGFEYNYTRQLKKEIYETRYSYSENVLYSINNISIPVGLRFNFLPELNWFAELNFFFDLVNSGKRSGTMHSFIPDQNNNIVHTELKFTDKSNLSPVNFGFSPSVGCRIPVLEKKFLILKLDYKWGLLKLFSTYSGQDSFFNKYFRFNMGFHF
jgi:hypothetical protein